MSKFRTPQAFAAASTPQQPSPPSGTDPKPKVIDSPSPSSTPQTDSAPSPRSSYKITYLTFEGDISKNQLFTRTELTEHLARIGQDGIEVIGSEHKSEWYPASSIRKVVIER